MTPTGQTPEEGLTAEDMVRLRDDLEKVKADQAQIDQRKTDLIATVKRRIATLQDLLAQHGETTEPLMLSSPTVPVSAKSAQPSVIESVRRELIRVGREIETASLKEALLTRYGVTIDRLKNFSQLLYNAPSVYKEEGKVGLVEWQKRKATPKTPKVDKSVVAPTSEKPQKIRRRPQMTEEQRQAVAERMKAYWATRRETTKPKAKARKA